jgi:hypothetical protein
MEDLMIVINTCKEYFKNTKSIIDQITELKYNKSNFIIVSGQEDSEEETEINSIKLIKVKYTGLHQTGAIYISENYNKYKNYKYFMFLPDTIKFGTKFMDIIKENYEQYIINSSNKLLVLGFINPVKRPSMDMGILHIDHIIDISEYFKCIKCYDITRETLVNLKKLLIYDENTILGTKPITKNGTNFIKIVSNEQKKFICNNKNNLTEKKIKVNDKLINEVYISNIDLYKYQRNFRGLSVLVVLDY